jgi:hypothetical protein
MTEGRAMTDEKGAGASASHNETPGRKPWNRPQVKHLGDVKDVQGPSGTGSQASGGGQLRS